MDLGLNGKRAVVTGASKGIGLSITQALVAEGVSVVAGARTTTPQLDVLVDRGRVHAVTLIWPRPRARLTSSTPRCDSVRWTWW